MQWIWFCDEIFFFIQKTNNRIVDVLTLPQRHIHTKSKMEHNDVFVLGFTDQSFKFDERNLHYHCVNERQCALHMNEQNRMKCVGRIEEPKN